MCMLEFIMRLSMYIFLYDIASFFNLYFTITYSRWNIKNETRIMYNFKLNSHEYGSNTEIITCLFIITTNVRYFIRSYMTSYRLTNKTTSVELNTHCQHKNDY